MKAQNLWAALAVAALVVAGVSRAEDKKDSTPKLDGIKCPVSDQKASADASVSYKGGKVYLCCENCPKAFEKDVKKFATKANMQLVATGQAKQGACPFSGGKVNADTAIEVSGAKIAFCCEKCQAKAKELGDKQAETLF